MRRFIATAAALVLLGAWNGTAEAQARAGGIGVMVGVHGMWTPSFDITEPGEPGAIGFDSGFGVSARLGVAITPALSLFGAWDQSWHASDFVDDGQLRHLFGGVRVNLPVLPALAPYVSGGYGWRRIGGNAEIETGETAPMKVGVRLRGDFIDVGAGTMIYLGRTLALDIGGNFSFGDFDSFRIAGVDVDVDTDDTNIWRIRAGVTWSPMTGR